MRTWAGLEGGNVNTWEQLCGKCELCLGVVCKWAEVDQRAAWTSPWLSLVMALA